MANGRRTRSPMRHVLLAFLVVTAACVPHQGRPAPGARTIFFDDFDGRSLDRTKWNVEVRGAAYNNEQQAYVDSAPTVFIAHGKAAQGASKGALVIRPLYAPGYVSADG